MLKIVLVGASNSGSKTCYAIRITHNKFDADTRPTVGPSFNRISRVIDNRNYKTDIELYDLSGHEGFRSSDNLLSPHFKGAHGFILGYDITDQDSFQSAERWRVTVRNKCPYVPILFVGNKSDLLKSRKVSLEEAQQYATKHGLIGPIEISAKDGSNIEQSFQVILRAALKYSESYLCHNGEAKINFKVALWGDGGAGKTSLLQRFAHDSYSEECTVLHDDLKLLVRSTVLIRFVDCHVEKFREFDYYSAKGTDGFIVAFDLTNVSSFSSVKQWIEDINRFATEDVCIILAGCKSDSPNRQVDFQVAMEFATGLGISYIETSAKSADNVSHLFDTLTEALLLRYGIKKREDLLRLVQTNQREEIQKLLETGISPICPDGTPLVNWCVRQKLFGMAAWLTKSTQELTSESELLAHARKTSPIRVCFLGAPAAGKSTLRLMIQSHLSLSTSILSPLRSIQFPLTSGATDGIAIDFAGEYVFWDFGGQEVLYSTHEFFLTPECQFIIVVDLALLVSDNQALRNQTKRNTEYWVKLLQPWTLSHKSAPVIIVGTHCDQISDAQIKQAKTELDSLASKFGLPKGFKIVLMSNATRGGRSYSRGIKQLANLIQDHGNSIIRHHRGMLKNSIANFNFAHTALRLTIERQRELGKYFIWWGEYETLCRDMGISTDQEIEQATSFLVNFGSILTNRHSSTQGISIVVLDPKWFSNIFTSIVSLIHQSSSSKRGFFTEQYLQDSVARLGISVEMFSELKQLFRAYQMIVQLSDGRYFVPAMIHAQKFSQDSMSTKERDEIFKDYCNQHKKILCFERRFKFDRIPFGLFERMVVRTLYYPGFDIHPQICVPDDFLLVSERFFVRAQVQSDEDLLSLQVWAEEHSVNLSFFCHFIFEFPKDLLCSYPLGGRILSSFTAFNSQQIGELTPSIREQFLSGSLASYLCPDLGLDQIARVDVSKIKVKKQLASGAFGIAWLIELHSENGQSQEFVCKELFVKSEKGLCEFIHEVLMMSILNGHYLVSLAGIGVSSSQMVESAQVNLLENQKPMKENQPLMILEFGCHGDLAKAHKKLLCCSLRLKVKIALDVALGLLEIHNSSGIRFIHRDVRSQNVFVFSLDESQIDTSGFVHAKLGDMGTVVVASPTYGEPLGNWQYSAPEAFRGSLSIGYSQSIDVYSFGILLWEILVNRPPFEEYLRDRKFDVAQQFILQGGRPEIPEDMPSYLVELIKNCWHQDPLQRPGLPQLVPQLEQILSLLRNEQNQQ
jgi:Ras-related protein Rab-1A